MKRIINKITPVLLSTFIITSCGMTGVMRGVDDTGLPIEINWTQGSMSDVYTATYLDEYFEGKAIQTDKRTSVGTFFSGGSFGTGITTSGEGNFKAVLIGNKGSSLRCLMDYASSEGWTPSGGVGSCIHSNGRTMEVFW